MHVNEGRFIGEVVLNGGFLLMDEPNGRMHLHVLDEDGERVTHTFTTPVGGKRLDRLLFFKLKEDILNITDYRGEGDPVVKVFQR